MLAILLTWLVFGRVYNKSMLNAVETFFIVNIAIYVAAIAYSYTKQKEYLCNIITCCMVSSAFIVFLLILGYHCYVAFSKTHIGKKIVEKQKSKANKSKATTEDDTVMPFHEPSVSYVEMDELRESLIA